MNRFKLLIFCFLVALAVTIAAQATRPGAVAVDANNYWGYRGTFPNPANQGAYIVCDGYIGSPVIPNTQSAVESFISNCEVSPPPSALPIIDVPENHSRKYFGYPAYEVKPPDSDYVYFACDGFLSSTSWCSYEAHQQAVKLRRVAGARYWEPGEKPLIIDDQPVHHRNTPQSLTQGNSQVGKNLNKLSRNNQVSSYYPLAPIDLSSIPVGQKIKLKKVPLTPLSGSEGKKLGLNQQEANQNESEADVSKKESLTEEQRECCCKRPCEEVLEDIEDNRHYIQSITKI